MVQYALLTLLLN